MLLQEINTTNNFNNQPSRRVLFKAKPIPKEVLTEFWGKVLSVRNANSYSRRNHKEVDLYAHKGEDYDTYFANVAMATVLRSLGIRVNFCRERANFGDFIARIKRKQLKKGSQPAPLSIVLDFNTAVKIASDYKDVLLGAPRKDIFIIDHHVINGDTINGEIYTDSEASSCCAVIYRFLQKLPISSRVKKKTLKGLFAGIVSDYQKNGLIDIKNNQLVKKLLFDSEKHKHAKEVFEAVESQLSHKERLHIYREINVLANLDDGEVRLQKKLFGKISVVPNGKLAYCVIERGDKDWKACGLDNKRTSSIMRNMRLRALANNPHDMLFAPAQKIALKGVQGVVSFYKANINGQYFYQFSLNSKGSYAQRLMIQVKQNWAKYCQSKGIEVELESAGGHENRAGGLIHSNREEDAKAFIQCFMDAAETIG